MTALNGRFKTARTSMLLVVAVALILGTMTALAYAIPDEFGGASFAAPYAPYTAGPVVREDFRPYAPYTAGPVVPEETRPYAPYTAGPVVSEDEQPVPSRIGNYLRD